MGDLASEAEAAKQQILAAGAQAGQAGVDAYAEAQRQIAAQKQQALDLAAAEATKIGAGNVDFRSLISAPADRLSQALGVESLSQQRARYGNALAGAEYSDKIAKLGPAIAAMAAASGGGGGGGGSGGGGGGRGGGGGGSDLSDSELRVVLKGAAQGERQAQVGEAASALQMARGGRKAAGKKVAQARKVVNQTRARVQKLQKQVRKADGPAPQRRSALREARAELRAAKTDLRKAKNQRVKIVTRQRQGYAGLRDTALQPLGPLAIQLGLDAGEDPARVQGLFGPSEQATLRNADIDELKDAGGSLEAFGRPPSYGVYGAGQQLKLDPKKVKAMRNSPRYADIRLLAEQYLEEGRSIGEFRREVLQPWSQPFETDRYNAKGKVVGVTKHPGYANLARLIELDYGPAFTR